jgi:hypothetical protein
MNEPDDRTRGILAVMVTIGFLSSVLLWVFHGVPKGNETIALYMLNTASTMFSMVIAFYFKKKRR